MTSPILISKPKIRQYAMAYRGEVFEFQRKRVYKLSRGGGWFVFVGQPNMANPALMVPFGGRGTSEVLSVSPIAERKSKRGNVSWFSKRDNENVISFVVSSTSMVNKKFLRYSIYIDEGSLVRAVQMLNFDRKLSRGVSKHCRVCKEVDSEDMIDSGFREEDERI
ncbi:hypothetical protein Tco_1553082 [Tanacetum coccineum]